jgi:hypothetical protein
LATRWTLQLHSVANVSFKLFKIHVARPTPQLWPQHKPDREKKKANEQQNKPTAAGRSLKSPSRATLVPHKLNWPRCVAVSRNLPPCAAPRLLLVHRAAVRFLIEVEIAQCLPGSVADVEAFGVLLDRPGWREAGRCLFGRVRRPPLKRSQILSYIAHHY